MHRRLPGTRWSPTFVAFVTCGVAIGTPLSAHADHGGAAAERAAREIQDARDRADAAAQALFDMESTIDGLEQDIERAQADLVLIEADVESMRSALAASAVQRFTQGATVGNPLFRRQASQAAPRVLIRRLRHHRRSRWHVPSLVRPGSPTPGVPRGLVGVVIRVST